MHWPQAGTLVALRTRPRPAPAAGSAGDEENDLAAAIAASLADAGKCWVLRAIVWASTMQEMYLPLYSFGVIPGRNFPGPVKPSMSAKTCVKHV